MDLKTKPLEVTLSHWTLDYQNPIPYLQLKSLLVHWRFGDHHIINYMDHQTRHSHNLKEFFQMKDLRIIKIFWVIKKQTSIWRFFWSNIKNNKKSAATFFKNLFWKLSFRKTFWKNILFFLQIIVMSSVSKLFFKCCKLSFYTALYVKNY